MSEKTVNRAKRARVRAVIAIVLAFVLLAATGFAFVDMLRGADFTADVTQLTDGDYIAANVDMILGYYAEEFTKNDNVTALYAVVPYDGRLAVVILPERYFDSADVIFDATYAFINGKSALINNYILVTGTAETLTEETCGMFYDWFGLNKDWMVEAGLISGEVEDYADHLSDVALRVDRTGRLSSLWSFILTGLAWALLMYAVIVFLRLALGKYEPKPVLDEEETPQTTEADTDPETEPGASETDSTETEEFDSEA